ncbi:hypothetical protein J4416_00585 [Candidatus Pacearchaeota archaeon]|nr:hypothetical protein [Candidatus Pacearchaeota archaeon]
MYSKALLLTHKDDRHADAVSAELSSRGIDYFRVNTEEIIEEYGLNFYSSLGLFTITSPTRKETIDETWVIWNRRVSDPVIPQMKKDLEQIVYNETLKTWEGLLFSANGKVVNRPWAENAANNKINNLLFAKSYGIKIPETLVTNIPGEFELFYRATKSDNKKICHKLQKVAIVERDGEDFVTYTNLVGDDVLEDTSSIRSHPNLFQRYIDKLYEVRVTALEDMVTAIAIHSQDSELSKVDFRRYDFENVKYEKIELPSKIDQFCRDLLRKHSLSFGAFDFIVNPQGEYYFLELNPNGQWLWLEHMSKHNLTKPFVDNLLK